MKRDDLPVHDIPALDGNNAPVTDESVFEDMEVIGTVPTDLNGLYVRNGPNQVFRIGTSCFKLSIVSSCSIRFCSFSHCLQFIVKPLYTYAKYLNLSTQ